MILKLKVNLKKLYIRKIKKYKIYKGYKEMSYKKSKIKEHNKLY